MICEQIREMVEAYALGALDAPDQAMVETHLAECPNCRRLVNEYAEIVNTLPQAVALASPLQPPDFLKARLLQSLETASPQTSDVSKTEEVSPIAPPQPVTPILKQAQETQTPPKPSWWRARPLVTVAVTLLIVVLLVWSVQLSVALARERALRAEFANLVDQQEIVLEVIDSNQTTRAVLRPPAGSDSTAYGKLFTRSDLPHVVAMAARLPQPPAGQAYHLWVTNQAQTQLAGVMKVNDQGFGLLVFDADHDGPVYESAQLTLQSAGSQAPVSSPVLVWQAGQK